MLRRLKNMNQPTRAWLLIGTSALFAIRLVLSLIRTGPVLVADEIGYLTNARVIAGGVAGQLELAPFYRGGYSLLLAPLIAIGANPTVTYHLILILNAVLVASVFPLLYLLLTRFAGVSPKLALGAAFAGATYPALTVLSQVAMSENALYPLVCLWLIACAGLLSRPDGKAELGWAAAVGASTGALWAVHNRMIVAVAIAVLGLVWLVAMRRIRPAAFLLAIAIALGAFLGTRFLDDFLIDRNYAGSAPDELSERMDELFRFDGVRTALANLLGQTWYLLVATFGLAAAATADFFRRWRETGEKEHPVAVQGLVLLLSALLLLVSAAAFPERSRPDMLIYGRYTEVIAPALIACGLIAIFRTGADLRRQATKSLLGFAVLTAVVMLIRATASDPDAANRWNISALPFVTVQLGPAILLGAALVAVAGAWLLMRAAAVSPAVLSAVAVALFGAVVLYGAWNPVRSSQHAVYPAGWHSPQSIVEAERGKRVAYDLSHYDTIGLYAVQWFLPNSELELFDGKRQAPPSRLFISGAAWQEEHPSADATPLWRDEGRDQTLWRLSKACATVAC